MPMICSREGCGKQTNNDSGVCIICEKYADLNASLQATEGGARKHMPRGEKSLMTIEMIEKKEKTMSGVAKEKICIDCKKTYQPTSNVQKRCTACSESHKATKKAGVVKTRSGNQAGKITALAPPKKVAGSQSAPGANSIFALLMMKKNDLEQEIMAIDTAIETIKKHAGVTA